MTATHVAGLAITGAGTQVRQRCGWCGLVLIDVDLSTVASTAPTTEYPTWPTGALVAVDGGVQRVVEPMENAGVPADACFHGRYLGPCDWDGEAWCWVDGCGQRATHRRFAGAIGEDEIAEMVCCHHAVTEWPSQ